MNYENIVMGIKVAGVLVVLVLAFFYVRGIYKSHFTKNHKKDDAKLEK